MGLHFVLKLMYSLDKTTARRVDIVCQWIVYSIFMTINQNVEIMPFITYY
jgi:hypothetical protein